jgi:hypothetical protein
MEKERAKEQAVKRETDEKLAAFRKHKDQIDKGVTEGPSEKNFTADEWSVTGKKRKQAVEKGILVKGVKLRKTESESKNITANPKEDEKSKSPVSLERKKPIVASLGLAGYSSDDDE